MEQTLRERAQALLELASRATEGPWVNNEIDPIHIVDYWGEKQAIAEVIGREAGTCADKEFIAASRVEAPHLAQKLIEALDVLERIANQSGPVCWQLAQKFLEQEADQR